MDDPVARTLASYEGLADEYRDRHADRSVVADAVERFDDALGAARTGDGGSSDGSLPSDRPTCVLDVGCGPAWEAATLADRGHDVTAIDITPAFLRQAGDVAPSADRARMDMRSLAFAPGSFDGVWACASFLHVPREDAPATLAGFERVLRDGGVLFCAVQRGEGERDTEGSPYDAEDERRFTLYDPESFREIVEDAGFTVDSLVTETDSHWLQVVARTA
ncbi:class I SAM-dependent methyltransferase [Halomarina salina]|uniref:Class I SAM-dependent methyltransferase n=1 Tax=Halomarina salina TaxID=1872699 RepID=A0ABD5RQY0_9EURY|nr:class I SAM-dependent methyltransferase [Halomarina salina]